MICLQYWTMWFCSSHFVCLFTLEVEEEEEEAVEDRALPEEARLLSLEEAEGEPRSLEEEEEEPVSAPIWLHVWASSWSGDFSVFRSTWNNVITHYTLQMLHVTHYTLHITHYKCYMLHIKQKPARGLFRLQVNLKEWMWRVNFWDYRPVKYPVIAG